MTFDLAEDFLNLLLVVLKCITVPISLWKFKFFGGFWGVSGDKIALFWPIMRPIFWVFCLLLQFFTMESCYIWFTICLEYPRAYVYSCCPGKIQNHGLSGGIRGCVNLNLSHICLFLEVLCLFLKFSTLESCYIWFLASLEYPSAYFYSC